MNEHPEPLVKADVLTEVNSPRRNFMPEKVIFLRHCSSCLIVLEIPSYIFLAVDQLAVVFFFYVTYSSSLNII